MNMSAWAKKKIFFPVFLPRGKFARDILAVLRSNVRSTRKKGCRGTREIAQYLEYIRSTHILPKMDFPNL